MRLTIEPRAIGTRPGRCPHCGADGALAKHRLLPRLPGALVVFPSSAVFVCATCKGASRDESMLDRVLSALFLVPFLLVLLAGVGTGGFILTQMVRTQAVSAEFIVVALI